MKDAESCRGDAEADEGLGRLFDAAYGWFARNRLRLTGRAPRTCALPEASGDPTGPAPTPR